MKCGSCDAKTKLVRFGLISYQLCYECSDCGHREVYQLGTDDENREEVQNHLMDVPYEKPLEELIWLDTLDSMIVEEEGS